MKWNTIKGSGEYKSDCGTFTIVKMNDREFQLRNMNGDVLFDGKLGECKIQAKDIASHSRESMTVCRNDTAESKGKKSGEKKTPRARKGRGRGIVVPETAPESAPVENSAPETAPVVETETVESAPVVESTPVVHKLDWQEGERSEGESHSVTRWMEDRGDYLVGMLDYADRREFVAYRVNPAKGTISLPLEVDDKMRGKRYSSAESAFNACVEHARGKWENVESNHDVRIAQIPPRGIKSAVSKKSEGGVCCADHPLCSCHAGKRVSAGKRNGAIHGSEDKWGDTHLAHKIVNETLASAQGNVEMKAICAAVAAAGYVKANGRANTYYVHINSLRERGLISKQGSAYVVTSKGRELWQGE